MKRWPNLDPEAIRRANRKQAVIPRGATRAGAGRHRAGARRAAAASAARGPTVVVLPGPPRELQPMWTTARRRPTRFARGDRGRDRYRAGDAAAVRDPRVGDRRTLRAAEREGVELGALEITTCLRRGEIEVVTRYEPAAQEVYDAFEASSRSATRDTLFSRTARRSTSRSRRCCGRDGAGTTIADRRVVHRRAARRPADRPPGASAYVRGGVVVYSNAAKSTWRASPAELIERHGAVSAEVAEALADGRQRALRRRRRGRDHRHRRARRRHRGEAGRARLAERRAARGERADPLGQPARVARRRPRPRDHRRDAPAAPAAARDGERPPG